MKVEAVIICVLAIGVGAGCAPGSVFLVDDRDGGPRFDGALEEQAPSAYPLDLPAYVRTTSPTPGPSPSLQGPTPSKRFQVSLRGEIGGSPEAVGSISGLEFEFRLPRGFSVAPMLIYYQYRWEDDPDEEDGYGSGPGVEARWYVTREAFRRFYLGVGASILSGHWEGEYDENGNDRIDPGEDDEDDEVSIEVHGALGHTFRIGSHFGISPTFIVGNYVTSAEEGGGVFAGVGLRLSVAF